MASLNSCQFIGRVGRDPESRFTPDGTEVCNFSIACSKKFKGRDGQMQEKTEWVRIVVWGKQASFCSNYLHKGSLVYVSGELETRKWTNKDGVEQYTTEIKADRVVALDRKPDGQQAAHPVFHGRTEYGVDDMGDAPF